MSLTIQRSLFIQAVREFKEEKGIKLKSLFNLKDTASLPLRKEFWSKHAIQSYIARDSKGIDFAEYHPILDVDRHNKGDNDYYEWRIYQLAKEQNWVIWPFRDQALTDEFYASGAHTFCAPREDAVIRALACNELTSLIEVHKTDDIQLLPDADIQKIRLSLLRLQHLESRKGRFILAPNYSNGHAGVFLSLLDGNKILAAIHIDSQNSANFLENTKEGFHYQGTAWSDISSPKDKEIYDRYKKEGAVKIDREAKVAYLFDEEYFAFRSSSGCSQITTAVKMGWVDLVHNVDCPPEGESCYRIYDGRRVPILDASNRLQTAPDDKNCALYTYNTMQALVKLLEERGDRIYQMALKGEFEALKDLFQEQLKAYLPCYFDAEGKGRSEAELKAFHLKQRWELGSKASLNKAYLINKRFID